MLWTGRTPGAQGVDVSPGEEWILLGAAPQGSSELMLAEDFR
jgi:hypothetical protein